MRPYHDHDNWITKWIRSKMVTPEDREKKLAAVLGKIKNGADELLATPPNHSNPSKPLQPVCSRMTVHEPFLFARGLAKRKGSCPDPPALPFCAWACVFRQGIADADRRRTLLLRAALLLLAFSARQSRSLTSGAGGCATIEPCLCDQLEGGLGPM